MLTPAIRTTSVKAKRAYAPHAGLYQACGLCVAACPEGAISLVELAWR